MKTFMFLLCFFAGSLVLAAVPQGTNSQLSVDSQQPVIMMDPVKAKILGDLDIKLNYRPARNGVDPVIFSVVITGVKPGSRAAKLGIVPGDRIHRIQMMEVADLTKVDFFTKVLRQPVGDVFVLQISKQFRGPRSEISLPVSDIPIIIASSTTVASAN